MEQVLVENIASDERNKMALESLEKARNYHEKYLLGQHNSDLQEAISNYITAVKYNPMLPETYYRLASLMWEQGQICVETAIEQCKVAVSIAPDDMNAHLYTGFFMRLAQDYEGAEAEFKEAIRASRLSSARPRLVLSQAILQKITASDAKFGDYWNFLYYFLSGSVMLAWDKASLNMLYKNLVDDCAVWSYDMLGKLCEHFKWYPTAQNFYREAVQKTKHDELFYEKIGDLALKNKDTDTAVECYRTVLEANPAAKEVLVKLATILQTYYPDAADEAIDCYEKLLNFETNRAQIYYELGHLYLRKEDRLNSISAFKLACDECPENPFYNNSLAYAYAKAELYDDAIEHYKKAIALNPDNEWTSIVCQALGSLYCEVKENFEAAISTYQAGIILDPTNYDLVIALGDLYLAQYDLDNAIKAYCDAILLDTQDYRGYSKAGVALWEKDYVEEALVSFHKAVELNPENSFSYNNLGIIYLDGLGDAEEALDYFEEAISLNPNYTLAYYNAARASEIMGFTNDAANYYQSAIDLNRVTEDLDESELVRRLRKLFEAP